MLANSPARFPRPSAVVLLLICISAAVGLSSLRPAARPRLNRLPNLILWAWERPEDLRGLDPREEGVAFLAETVFLERDHVVVRPRRQPLRVAPGTAMVAVARIESDPFTPPALSRSQREAAVRAIARMLEIPDVAAVQVDFDATASQHQFYLALLEDLRARLPAGVPLSITALTSWCLGDPWVRLAPVDEAVPMLFRMGPEARLVRGLLANGADFVPGVCRTSAGVSTDERFPAIPPGRRIYVFHPRAWSPDELRAILDEAKQWR